MSIMMSKNLFACFQIWKRRNEEIKINLRTKFKARLVSLYKWKLRRAFSRWSSAINVYIIQNAEGSTALFENQVDKLKAIAMEEDKRFYLSLEALMSDQRKLLSKAISAMFTRKAREGLYQWRRAMASQQQKELAANMVIQKMRLRFVGHYFDIYKEFVHHRNQELFALQRGKDFDHMQDRRMLLAIYEKWCAFVSAFQKQKVTLRIVMTKLINAKIYRGFKRWVEGSQFKREWLLKLGQHSLTQDLETKH